MGRAVSIRIIIALFTVAICSVCLAVFWLVIFAAASNLARDQAHQVRVAHLQLVQAAVTEYFSTPPAVAAYISSQLHRRFRNITYTEIFSVTPSIISAVYAHKLTAGAVAVRVNPRTLPYATPNGSAPCDLDMVILTPTGGLIFMNATQPASRIGAVSGATNTSYTTPMQITRVNAATNNSCSDYSWSVLCSRFRRDGNRTADWGAVNVWGNVHIGFNTPLLSFATEFTNADGTQQGFIWVDVSAEAKRLAPFLANLNLGGAEVLFLVDREYRLIAASTGSVFLNASAVQWQYLSSPYLHPWIQKIGAKLMRSGLPLERLPADLSMDGLVASTMIVDDGRDLVMLVVSIAEERTLFQKLREAQKLTLLLGGVLLCCSIVLAAVLSWLVTRTLGKLVGVLGLVAEMRLEEIPPETLTRESRLLEVKLLQAVLFRAVDKLREFKLYMPATLFAEKDGNAAIAAPGSEANDDVLSIHSPSLQAESAKSQPTVASTVYLTATRGGLALGLSVRSGTVLMCDIAGFHELVSGTSSLQDVVAMHGRYVSAVLPAVRESRGVADGFVGDHIVASWNTQVQLATHRNAACACVLDIQQRLRCSQDRLVIRLAVASGRVYFGNLGSAERRAFSVIGPAMTVGTAVSKCLKDPKEPPKPPQEGVSKPLKCIVGIAGSVALEQKTFYHFTPVLLCTAGIPTPTVVYEIRGATTGGHNEWMYELQTIDQGNKPEVWALLQYVESNNRAAATRTLAQATQYLTPAFRSQLETYLGGPAKVSSATQMHNSSSNNNNSSHEIKTP